MTDEPLKTLKEMRSVDATWVDSGDTSATELECVPIRDLRAEAIRWVKSYKEENIRYGTKTPITKFSTDLRFTKMSWIIHFFNLTEEDIA